MLIFTILFLVFTLVSLLRTVVRAERVTHDTIYGALSVYLLMAITLAAAYLLLVTIQPGAIVMDTTRHPNHRMDWFDCVFYSFVTLTSLGYGDIVPITSGSLAFHSRSGKRNYVCNRSDRASCGLHASAKSRANPLAADFRRQKSQKS